MDILSRCMARFYDRAMRKTEQACLGAWRRELLAPLSGRVLEVGAGTGVNLGYFPQTVAELVQAEPDRHMRRRLQEKLASRASGHVVNAANVEKLPFPDHHFDAAVATLVFCSVRDPENGLAELHRVLKPGGRLYLIEHVRHAPDSRLYRWQKLVEPVWKQLAGNCHLTRDTLAMLQNAGFDCSRLQSDRMQGAPAIAAPALRGVAEKR